MLKIGGQRVPTRTLLLLVADGVSVVIGLFLATFIRFSDAPFHYLHRPGTFWRFLLVVLTCQVALYYNDLYDLKASPRRTELFVRLLKAFGTSCLVLAVVYYVHPDVSLGRGITALAALIILVLTLGWRLIFGATGVALGNAERILIVGTGPAGISLTRQVIARPELNLSVVGFLDEKAENIGKPLVNPGIIGAVADVEEITQQKKIDRVVLSLAERRGRMPVRQLLHLKFAGISVEDAYSAYERIAGRILLVHLSPSWLILSNGFRQSRFLTMSKRVVDVGGALVALILTFPITMFVALAIWLESGRPILYRQERIGLRGKAFQMLKFRSMRHDAEQDGPQWTADGDRRITRVGGFLRKWRLDELPQLFNVIRGEMSLVGPRPERQHFCDLLEEHIPFFALRHSVRPGITGWAQIKYQYGASVEEAKTKLEYDLFYIKHMSLPLDLAILFETAKVMIYGRGAK